MREVGRLAEDDFMISPLQMMELAGAGVSSVAARLLGSLDRRHLTVLAGPGKNGASGLVAARHMANRGGAVDVLLTRPVAQLHDEARRHVATLLTMHVRVCVVPWDIDADELDAALSQSDLLVDALLGYSASGAPRGVVADVVRRATASGRPVLSVDSPTGIDPDTGEAAGDTITAAATVTVALPKVGLLSVAGRRRAGSLYLVDIGLPHELYAALGLEFADPFGAGPLVRLT